MKVYISGPMTGLPEFNFPLFNRVAEELRKLDHEVSNPAEKGELPGWSWEDYLGFDLIEVCNLRVQPRNGLPGSVGSVVTLSNWTKSKGARLEVKTARALKIPVVPYAKFVHPTYQSLLRGVEDAHNGRVAPRDLVLV